MTLGFIILRHVNSNETNNLWIECYNSVRKFYPDNKIVIIDDNSNDSFVTTITLDNTIIIQSEYPGRGEVLPYYYYLLNKWFDTAVILHDSTFIKKYIDFTVERYKILWTFEHKWDQDYDEKRIIGSLTNSDDLLEFHDNKHMWLGCFGCMTTIRYDYLKMLDDKYTFSNLLGSITTRYNRCSFERVLACILMANGSLYNFTLFGDIHKYYLNVNRLFGYSYTTYLMENRNINLPIVKIWYWREQTTDTKTI